MQVKQSVKLFNAVRFKWKEVNILLLKEGFIDEWIVDRTGGGQEIAQTQEGKKTRLYAGGTIGIEELTELGLTKKDVTGKLKQFIQSSESKTRLLEDYLPEPDGDWQYSYNIIEKIEDVPLTIGMETIAYKGRMVFAHAFLNTPVE